MSKVCHIRNSRRASVPRLSYAGRRLDKCAWFCQTKVGSDKAPSHSQSSQKAPCQLKIRNRILTVGVKTDFRRNSISLVTSSIAASTDGCPSSPSLNFFSSPVSLANQVRARWTQHCCTFQFFLFRFELTLQRRCARLCFTEFPIS